MNYIDDPSFTDVENIDVVFNYDFPGNCEDYIHRIGRTGRGGKTGTSVTILTEVCYFHSYSVSYRQTRMIPYTLVIHGLIHSC